MHITPKCKRLHHWIKDTGFNVNSLVTEDLEEKWVHGLFPPMVVQARSNWLSIYMQIFRTMIC